MNPNTMTPEIQIILENLNEKLSKLQADLHLAMEKIEGKLDQRLESRDKRVDTLENRLREVERVQDRQKGINTVISVIVGAFASAVVIYLWNQIIK
jgi:CII-binding regulator of phage lambda lysogenization HflD